MAALPPAKTGNFAIAVAEVPDHKNADDES
jgi:hypothetical protein